MTLISSSRYIEDQAVSSKLSSLLRNRSMRGLVQRLADFYGAMKERVPDDASSATKRQLSRAVHECFVLLTMLDQRSGNAS
jgi:hypothetical protein